MCYIFAENLVKQLRIFYELKYLNDDQWGCICI